MDISSDAQPSRMRRLHAHFAQDVTDSWADTILLVACFITGITDSAVFNVWSCFVSMQTGNTIYAGLGVAGQPSDSPYRWVKSVTSIVSFMVGAYVISRACLASGPHRRITLCGSFALQALFCLVSAALVQTGVVPENAGTILPKSFIVLLPLALLSFQAAGQVVMSRILGYNEVPAVVMTMAYCDLMFDPKLLSEPVTQNPKRNRRALSIVAALGGAIAGGFLTKGGSIAWALWIAGGTKVAITIGLAFWKGKEDSVRLE